MILMDPCVFVQRCGSQLLSIHLQYSNPPGLTDKLLRTTTATMPDTRSGVSPSICSLSDLDFSDDILIDTSFYTSILLLHFCTCMTMITWSFLIFDQSPSLENCRNILLNLSIFNRFITQSQKRICADPDRLWTKTSMAFLDGKNYHLRRISHRRWHSIHLQTKRRRYGSQIKCSISLSSTDFECFFLIHIFCKCLTSLYDVFMYNFSLYVSFFLFCMNVWFLIICCFHFTMKWY